MSLNLNIRELRKAKGLTIAQLAEKVGVSTPHMSEVERGVKNLNNHLMERISAALGVSPRALLGKDETNLNADDDDINPSRTLVRIYGMEQTVAPGKDHGPFLGFAPKYLREMTENSAEYLAAIRVEGDSMSPTINDDDVVLIDIKNLNIDHDGIFVVQIGEALQVKRIGRGSRRTSIMVISDNPLYPPIDTEKSEIRVAGKVIWYGRKV